ncbi:MAG: cupin domain-containing protein [Aureispira sp.]|nr:cupin domain-containing protein [Aureispira sp.]
MLMTETKHFLPFQFKNGLLASFLENDYPAQLHAWDNQPLQLDNEQASYFAYIYEGTAEIKTTSGSFKLQAGMYFTAVQTLHLEGSGKAIIVEQLHTQSLFQLGGPVEHTGRLQYIDGCTDSLLIAPVMKGDPCLNLLHIPSGTFQTQHTHPSFRIGMIISGTGQCITPSMTYDLKPGLIFCIPKDAKHSFKTTTEDLRVIAYHPDSDFGPTHEEHPMINRTII